MAYYLFEDRVKKEKTFPYAVTRYCYEPKKKRDIVCIEHNHSQLELLHALRGKLVCYVDGQPHELAAGDTIIIDPFRQHVCEWSDDCDSEYICLTYTLNLLKKFSEVTLARAIDDIDGGSLSFDLIIKGDSPEGEIVGELIRKIDGTYKAGTASDILYGLSSAYQLLARLTERHMHEEVESETVRRDKAFMRDIQRYVFDHFREDIHTSDAAKALFMNKTQFCTQFTKHFDCNFSHYLCRYRILIAMEDYGEAKMPIYNIAEAVGFSDYCYFSKKFKAYAGVAPAVYFRKYKGKTELREN